MSIICKYYKKSEYGKQINILERMLGIFGEKNSMVYERRMPKENEGKGIQLKIFFLRENENAQGVIINLAIDFPMKIMNYEKHGELKYTEKYSEFAPFQFFILQEDYVAILCPKKVANKAVEAINKILIGRNGEEALEACEINLNNQTLNDEMKRFWASGIQDRFSKSASIAGTNLKNKSDYNRQINQRGGTLGAIVLESAEGDYEYGLSREGIFWIKSKAVDSHREEIILENLTRLINMGIIS